jgi:mono/diheme cytochrome c family protein
MKHASVMQRSFFFLLFTLIAGACGDENTTADPSLAAKAYAAEKKTADGQKIFKQYCVACHGIYGDMGVGGAANLAASSLSVEERILVITNGRNAMAPFSSLLSEEKIKAVAEYTLQLSTGKE